MASDGFPPSRPDGTNHGQSRASATLPSAVKANTETMLQAAQLRAAGATFREIGEALGIDYTWARTLVLKALEAAAYEAADMMRVQEGQRLDRMQRAVWRDAINGDVVGINTVLKIMDRRAKLFGLDSPVKLDARVSVGDVDEDLRRIDATLEAADGPVQDS